MEDQLPTPAQAPQEPTPPQAPEPTGSGRFAVYDNELRRYVGPVHDKRPTAKDAKALADGHDYDIREV